MMTDPIADMLTRIRNANRTGQKRVKMPASKLKVGVAEILKDEGFIGSYRVEPDEPQSRLLIELKYGPDGEPVIRNIERISKPGRRIYSSARDLAPVLRGQGISILSTPNGVLSDRTARRDNVGGEVLAQVY